MGLGDLGFYAMAVVFMVGGITGFIAPSFVSKYSCRVSLMVAISFVLLWQFTGLLCTIEGLNVTMIQVFVITTSALKGFGQAILTVAQGKYLAIIIHGSPER